MKISKVVRRTGKGAAPAMNAVVAVNVGEAGEESSASTRQDVDIVQRDGRTVVRHRTPGDERQNVEASTD